MYKQKKMLTKGSDYNRELTYMRHKDNYPLELKGNMRKKIVPCHKEVKIPRIKTYNHSSLSSSRSSGFLTSLIAKSECKPLSRQRRHFPKNPEILNRYYRGDDNIESPKRVSLSKLRKLQEDIQDHIDLRHSATMDDSQIRRMNSEQKILKATCKKHFETTNLFLQSEFLYPEGSRRSMRKVNLNRTKSSIVLK